jgi:hypothetical protein
MPVPASTAMKATIVASLISKGLTKRSYVNGETVDSGQITPDMEKIVDAIIDGVIEAFTQYHTTTTVTVAGVTPGPGAATGTLV